jgi:erythrocyte band 7 integral membrane protein
MRQAADILSSAPAMQIRYLEAMQAMAKSANSKVIFLPGASSVGSSMQMAGALGEGSEQNGGPVYKSNDTDFGGQGSDFQRAINAHVVENI